MIEYIKNRLSFFTVIFIIIIVFFSAANTKWGDQRWYSLLRDDGKGYYAYLPAVFIYHDLSFSFYDDIEAGKYKHRKLPYDYRYNFQGSVVNKYYCGTAIAELPGFLLAHWMSTGLGYDADGYSKPYLLSISIFAILYMLLGLLYLRKTLILYGASEINMSIILLSIGLGTHLFYYAIAEPSMSHVFSFGLLSLYIFIGKSYFLSPKKWQAIALAALIAWISLIRPVNVLVVFLLPFLAGSFASLKKGFLFFVKENTVYFILSILVALAIVSIQFVIYYLQSGHFIVYSYGEEGFNFLDPHMIDILFSYKKGLFVYTPLTFIATFGFIVLFKRNQFAFYSLLAFGTLLTYILASWWSWYYGGSFSSRVYIEYLPLFAILLLYLLDVIRRNYLRKAFLLLLVGTLFLNQIQTYQYRLGHIHYVDMNKEKYWEVFPLKRWVLRALAFDNHDEQPKEEKPSSK